MPFNAPKEAIYSVLRRLRIDPAERITERDQDPEYTACRSEEIPQYFELYSEFDLSRNERAVLCCFMLEGLNELIQNGNPHTLQDRIIDALMATDEHAQELAYWMDTSDQDQDQENWWPITTALQRRLRARDAQDQSRE